MNFGNRPHESYVGMLEPYILTYRHSVLVILQTPIIILSWFLQVN